MTISAQHIESEALSLPREERTRLAMHLLESIEERPSIDPRQVELAWVAEANRRYLAYLHGDEQSISADEVFAELGADDR
ncbi:MAG: addiction module protein [Pseudohongiella sp.]|uniref:addiction module protein n=1 Tax=Pseudohongiella sp. TaxID=1979412 RepID=UPI00349FD842